MREVIGYQIVKAESSEGVTRIVNDLLEQGWQPLEGVKITTEINEGLTLIYFYQTMVKFEE